METYKSDSESSDATVQDVKSDARRFANEAKDTLKDIAEGFGETAKDAASGIRKNDPTTGAARSYVRQAADGIELVGDKLTGDHFGEIVQACAGTVRKNPIFFVTTALGLGLFFGLRRK